MSVRSDDETTVFEYEYDRCYDYLFSVSPDIVDLPAVRV